jgi:monofunctional glycosyltransferase
MSEAAAPSPTAQVVAPLTEAEASPQAQESDQPGAAITADAVADGLEQHPVAADGLPAAAWASPEAVELALAIAASPDGIGRLERENRPLERTDEGPASAPDPAPAAPDGQTPAADAPAPLVASETLPTIPQREDAADTAQVPEEHDTVQADAEGPAETSLLPAEEPPLRELQDAASPAVVPAREAPVQAPPSPSVVHAEPVEPPPPPPTPAAPPMPIWQQPAPQRGTTAREPASWRGALPWLVFVLRGTALVLGGLVVTVLALTLLYRWVNPPISTLMIGRSIAGTQIERTWVPLERISPHLMRAVILSEDGGFCRHRGVDWGALEEAIETDRGGSTITMQVVKNLFLWPSRSYVRKAIEIGLAYLVDALWSKRRILEIYLNIAEWGDGVFGAEAAAQAHFGKRAGRLTAEEAALLASVLPNPIERTAGAPSLMTGRLASRLLVRMRSSRSDLSCVPVPRLEPRRAPQSPYKEPQRSLQKPPLVQGPRLTL